MYQNYTSARDIRVKTVYIKKKVICIYICKDNSVN